eukprot:2280180-Pyramimonas_sp.AAC.1
MWASFGADRAEVDPLRWPNNKRRSALLGPMEPCPAAPGGGPLTWPLTWPRATSTGGGPRAYGLCVAV